VHERVQIVSQWKHRYMQYVLQAQGRKLTWPVSQFREKPSGNNATDVVAMPQTLLLPLLLALRLHPVE
jgi:hypothetical protein